MSRRTRFKNRAFSMVAGFLVGLLLLQMTENIFPALHFLSPVPAQAASVGIIDPDGNGTVQGTQTTCGTANNFDCVNDAVRSPTAPSITGDYVQFARNQGDYYTMSTLSGVQTVTDVTVYIHHLDGAGSYQYQIELYDATEITQYGTTQTITSSNGASQWDTATFSGLSLTQSQLDGLKVRTLCIRSGGGNSYCRTHEVYAEVTYDPVINVTVSTAGSQQDLVVNVPNQYVGGTFIIEGTNGSRSITDISIVEQGTVDAQNDLSNIRLYYDLDVTSPYACDTESYSGTENQFGATSTSFSATNGTSTFTDSVSISTTQTMCVYVVLDVDDTASAGENLDIQITNPTTDVVGTGSPVISPASAILLSGQSTLTKGFLTQENYHWRNDNGNETGATSATGGTENTVYTNLPKLTNKRLRVAVSNDGTATSESAQFRLEYASKVSTCVAATGWTDVGAVGGDFDMSSSTYLTDGSDTTDISIAGGGVTNPNTNHLTINGGFRDINSQTGTLVLTTTQFVELEYSIIATSTVTAGSAYCFRVTDAGTPLDGYTNYPEAIIAADVFVSPYGTQATTISIPSTNQYSGGAFVITNSGSNNLTSVTITASGTIDAQNDLSNVKLRYDLDTTTLDCSSVSYAISDPLFGSATTFNGSNQATFTGSVNVSSSQTVCLYVEYDVGSGAINGELLDVRIVDPSTQVVVTSSTVAPASVVDVSGVTTMVSPVITQVNYHWRNNDGNETGATSATDGSENTPYAEAPKNTGIRLRFAIGNTGLGNSASIAYRLEWTQKVSTCALATGWARIDTSSDEWQMSPTGNLTDGANTTDIAVGNGGVSNPAGTFLSSNGGIKTTSDTTTGVILPADNYLDLEYSISATAAAVQGATYCFRVTDAGTPLPNYTNYPEATIKLDTDFKVQRGVATLTGDTLTLTAGVDYEAPATNTSAFIRITNTQLTGAGPNTGNSSNNANDTTVYITNPSNIVTSVTFARGTGAVGNTRVGWEIVEYTGVSGGENEIKVRRQEAVSYVSTNVNATGTATSLSPDIVDADVVVFITGQRNLDAGRNNFHQGLSTVAWDGTANQAVFTRGASGVVSDVSYALVEFTGSNWKIQRFEHTYTTASSTETATITAVNSLSRTFLHVQKRTSQNNHADFGHEVWLSSIGQISFKIDGQATNPANHTSVAWVIENTQSQGNKMEVTRSYGTFPSAGAGPEANSIPIGKTLDDLSIASLFVNNRSDETQRSWPEPILGARLTSNTNYELWRSDTSANIVFRTEVVEWPTALRKLEQNYYRILVDNDGLKPAVAWPSGAGTLGENAEMTADDNPMTSGDTARIRMTLSVVASAMPSGLDSFKLEYGKKLSTCSAVSSWLPVGDVGSTTALWRGVNNTPADGTALSIDPPTGGDLWISIATVAGTYEEEGPSATNPFTAFPGDEVEFDWVLQHNGADDKSSYCFRMVEADGTQLSAYNFYPVLRTVGYEPLITNWRWYDDETSLTPTSPLALENITPNNIANQNALKLRLVLREASGADGINVKFALQFSEYADFSQGVYTAVATSTCVENSLWCYYDGDGTDNSFINSAVISDADSCVAGVGAGCGTHNEGTSTVNATFDQVAYTSAEYEFTVLQAGARTGAVYYFRLYDLVNDEVVGLDSGASYPSLAAESAQLASSVTGITTGTTVAGVTSDVDTTPSSIGFGSLGFGSSYEAIQRISVNTNSTEGYKLFVYVSQQLTNSYGDTIPAITSTNDAPDAWGDACSSGATGCFGYHTTDSALDGGSARFAPDDSYAAFSTDMKEVMYSSIPTNDTEDIIYRIAVTEDQVAGDYETAITFISVPVY